jgi:putative transposase
MPEHVRVFVSAHPKFSPSYIYKMFKGISARRLLMEFTSLKKGALEGSSLEYLHVR